MAINWKKFVQATHLKTLLRFINYTDNMQTKKFYQSQTLSNGITGPVTAYNMKLSTTLNKLNLFLLNDSGIDYHNNSVSLAVNYIKKSHNETRVF